MTRITEISKFDDIIDVGDVISVFEALDDEREGLVDTLNECREAADSSPDDVGYRKDVLDASEAVAEWMEANREEYESLRDLLSELKGAGGDEHWRGDWYPITLIRDSHFERYAEELADEIGAINSEASWPNNCIDWERAARELQQDYSTVEFDGVTYWYR